MHNAGVHWDARSTLDWAGAEAGIVSCVQTEEGDVELFCVYVPTNHIYVGDIFLLGEKDIIRNTLSVREGIGEWGGRG